MLVHRKYTLFMKNVSLINIKNTKNVSQINIKNTNHLTWHDNSLMIDLQYIDLNY